MSFEKERETASQIVTNAASRINKYKQEGYSTHRKDNYETVTEIDIAIQQFVVDRIQETFPADGIRGEEENLDADNEDRVWSVDPIDGTANFVHDNPFYCISLSLADHGTPVVGAVYAPALDLLFEAVKGNGVWLNGEHIEIGSVDAIQDSIIMYTPVGRTKNGSYRPDGRFLENLLATGCSFRKYGATALELCFVASGKGDAYIAPSTTPWDAEAGRLIAAEAGAQTRWNDSTIEGKKEVIAANPSIMDRIERLVDDVY